MPSSTPSSGRRDLGVPIFSATPTGPRPSQEPEAGYSTSINAEETSSTPHINLEDFVQNPYTNQQPSTGDAATTHTLQQTSNPYPHTRHYANRRNDEQQSSQSGSDKSKSSNYPKNYSTNQADIRRQRKIYLLRQRRIRRQPQPASMALLTDTLSSLTTTDAPAPAINHREVNLLRLQRQTSERIARQMARNREMDAEQAARRSRDVERRIQSGENPAGEEGDGAGGLSIADGFPAN